MSKPDSVYDRRRYRETHDSEAWSVDERWYHPDVTRPAYDDQIFYWLDLPVTILGLASILYFVVRLAMAVWAR